MQKIVATDTATEPLTGTAQQLAFHHQMNRDWSMSNIVTGRQLRAARILAGLTARDDHLHAERRAACSAASVWWRTIHNRSVRSAWFEAPVSELESHLGQRHQPAKARRCVANTLNLLPLSAA
jgi:hypothetical protein